MLCLMYVCSCELPSYLSALVPSLSVCLSFNNEKKNDFFVLGALVGVLSACMSV